MKRLSFPRGAKRLAIQALVLAAAASATAAAAASFSVTPVRIYIAPKDRAVAVTIANEGDAPVALQADLNLWTQTADGSDQLTPTDDLVLSPPIVKLAPGARQVVRLALVKPADRSRQLTYRLVMREIPEVAAPKESGIQLPISLALSMPVFITPPAAARDVSCQVVKATGVAGGLAAQCVNSGTAYAQVRDVRLVRGDKTLAAFEGGAYILPGARKTMPLKGADAPAAGAARLTLAYDDAKTESFDVALQ